MPVSDQGQAGTQTVITDRVELERAVLAWLTSWASLHAEGGLGDVEELAQAILPFLRIPQAAGFVVGRLEAPTELASFVEIDQK